LNLAEALQQSRYPHSAINKSGKHTIIVAQTPNRVLMVMTEDNQELYPGRNPDDALDFLRRPINYPRTDDLDLDAWEAVQVDEE